MIRLTYDTNIYISGVFWRGNPRKLIEKAIGKEVELFVSKHILNELGTVLQRDFKASERSTEQIITNILKISRLIEVRTRVDAIKRDPEDNKILACAVESKSEYLVSGDVHLHELKEYKGIKIVTASEMLKILEK